MAQAGGSIKSAHNADTTTKQGHHPDQKPFDVTGCGCYVVAVNRNVNLNLLLNALLLCRVAVGF
jgi:hypothetical protein